MSKQWRLNIYDAFSEIWLCAIPLLDQPAIAKILSTETWDEGGELEVDADTVERELGVYLPEKVEVSFTIEVVSTC